MTVKNFLGVTMLSTACSGVNLSLNMITQKSMHINDSSSLVQNDTLSSEQEEPSIELSDHPRSSVLSFLFDDNCMAINKAIKKNNKHKLRQIFGHGGVDDLKLFALTYAVCLGKKK